MSDINPILDLHLGPATVAIEHYPLNDHDNDTFHVNMAAVPNDNEQTSVQERVTNVINPSVNPVSKVHGKVSTQSSKDSSTSHSYSNGNATPREKISPVHPDGDDGVKSKVSKWNNTHKARHWNITFNNYTLDDENRIQLALKTLQKSGDVTSAIVAREVGVSGTPHLQCYVHFNKPLVQSGVHHHLGYDKSTFHLSVQSKEKPPVASFRYCMKGGDFYVIGKNLDDIDRSKLKVKIATGKCSNVHGEAHSAIESREITNMKQFKTKYPKLASEREDYWRNQIILAMKEMEVPEHPLKEWQKSLLEKLLKPDITEQDKEDKTREIIFVVDKKGKSGKSWFAKWFKQHNDPSYIVGADKRNDITCALVNLIVETGSPHTLFMDVTRSRGKYISFAFLEEVKNGIIVSPKYKSIVCPLEFIPNVVVMTNSWPAQPTDDEGLSDDRYVYLAVGKDGKSFEWFYGFRQDEGGAMAPGFVPPIIQTIEGHPYIDNGASSHLDGRKKTMKDTIVDCANNLYYEATKGDDYTTKSPCKKKPKLATTVTPVPEFFRPK